MTLRETLGRIARAAVPPNEEAAKFQIIVPVLGDLGWDVYNSHGTDEVRYEHQAGSSRSGGRVDIALMGRNDQCACFVEAKSPGANLDDHVAQLLGYAFHDGVTVCALTDGLEWRLYLPREAGKPEARQFARLRLQENPIEQSADDLEAFLSREAVRSGKAEREASKVLKRLQEESDIVRKLPEIWRKMLTKPDEDLIELVRTKVYAELRLSPSVDQVAAVLSGQEVALSRPGTEAKGLKTSVKEAKKPGSRRRITGATVLGTHKEMRKWCDLVPFVAEQIYARHKQNFLEMTAHLQGSKRDRVSSNGQSMYRPVEIVSGIFVESDWGTWAPEWSIRLLEVFGYSGADLQIHEE